MAALPTLPSPWDDPWNDTLGNDTWGDLYEDLGAAEIPVGHRLVLALYALIFLLGVLGNGAVLWVTAAELRRTVNGVWFSHLALADLLSCLALPFLALPLTTDHHWPLGRPACKVLPSLTVLAMFSSVLLLTAISADRCALVTRPVWCHNRRTPALAAAACAGAWAAAALLTVPSFVFRTVRLDPFSDKATCVLSYGAVRPHQRGAELTVAVVRFLCGFLGPFAVISGCYGRLLSRVRARGLGRSQRATRTVLVVIVSFFVCWLPYHVVGLVLAASAPDTAAFRGAQAADPAVAGLAYVNGCVNPIIYLAMGRGLGQVRRSWRALLKGVLSDEPASAAGDCRARSTATTEEGSDGTAV
ncbi:C5a anaphylatoxin chemotactic receptor 1-like [Motacilla alba alba]|uniref:C5a anaphylatoxin chemotactic receptor 1-like n=1 Tax=Motacilla alba alba TaxID=1094192 RepID=UPI0018D53CC9|nr:C5a anaphylatoxin chemotactic receptor 1-like [Motacilla alba alba]XP_037988386.1 C5a anaphylatoxin chemotactic receptor 1-like [Motacilla alba alba]